MNPSPSCPSSSRQVQPLPEPLTPPEFYRYDPMTYCVPVAICSTIAAIFWGMANGLSASAPASFRSFLRILGGLAVGITALPLGKVLFIEFLNGLIRRLWLGDFPHRVPGKQLREFLAAHPTRYHLHFRYYGGFDINGLPPICVIEDLTDESLLAVHPLTYDLSDLCEELHVPHREYR